MARSIVEAVFANAERRPDKLCLVDEQAAWTYRAFAERIRRCAGQFARMGIGNGERVAVEASHTADYLSLELGMQLCGAVFVPAERNCGEKKLAAIAGRCGAKLVISEKEPAEPDAARVTRSAFLAAAEAGEPAESLCFPAAETVSEILFSTGTTGKEKGIVLTHGSDIALADNVICGVEMEEDNVELIPSPLNHSHGLRRCYANLVRGATIVLTTGVMNVKLIFERLEQYRVTAMDLVPTALSVLLRLSGDRLAAFSHQLRYIQLGAAPLADADRQKLCALLPQTRLYNFYGSTESGCVAIYNFNDGRDKPRCIGKATCRAELFLADEDGRAIPQGDGAVGLLAARGGQNMLGYWEDPEETAQVLRGGCVLSRDEAYFDGDGDIILLGRRGDVINVGGNKVSPEEIEDAARALPEIADCGCVPTADPLRGQAPVLFVELAPGCAFDPAAIRSALQRRLEPYKLPVRIEVIDRLPRSYNGKLLRRELRSFV